MKTPSVGLWPPQAHDTYAYMHADAQNTNTKKRLPRLALNMLYSPSGLERSIDACLFCVYVCEHTCVMGYMQRSEAELW